MLSALTALSLAYSALILVVIAASLTASLAFSVVVSDFIGASFFSAV
jgi:hypothetical protein